ncbi:MAG: cation-translocating P-type ATPase [Deltaproteobacteria bacterium]|nr:cation-translocating P-type ATPase [Deltaproteobacteria bacterium]
MSSRIVFRISGLCCGVEGATLCSVVMVQDGVLNVEVDVLSSRLSVTYDGRRITPKGIMAVVAGTGMKAEPWPEERSAPAGEQGMWRRRIRLTLVVCGAFFLGAGFASHWAAGGTLLEVLAGAGEQAPPSVSRFFYLAAVSCGAWFVLPKALAAVKRLRPDMNLLMTIAVAGAIALGEWFEAASVAVLFALALLLEEWSVVRARRAIGALLALSPPTARFLGPGNGEILEKPLAEVPVGATVLVRPGERIPLDGIVLKGFSSVDQAPITGESMPVAKAPGDELFAGAINGDGALEYEVSRPAADSALARIIRLVQEAQSKRAPSEQWVERFALYYTPAMILLAAGIALLPPVFLAADWGLWFYRALVILVIACPCALVISTPVSVVSGLTAAARNGVLIKGGSFLEAAGRIGVLAVDKTGTLTRGEPEVKKILTFQGHTEREVAERAAALELHSDHPLARAILRWAEGQGIRPLRAESFRVFPGKGAEAVIEGRRFWIGSHRFLEEMKEETAAVQERAEALQRGGHSVVAVGNEEHVCGLISIADGLREGVATMVAKLHRLGVRPVVMLTGDNAATARAIAASAGVDDWRAELLPEDKVAAVGELARCGFVAMVGDGVNDAPAMAAAHLGIAMGVMGSDAAIETADVALMTDDLDKIPWLIRHSRRTVKIIRQNILFALAVKLLFVLLTLLGTASLWLAIAADMGASLLVVGNGLRLLRGEKNA